MSKEQATLSPPTDQKAIRWVPLACPHCQVLFRVRKEVVGHPVRCPHCAKGIWTGDGTETLLPASFRRVAESEGSEASSGRGERRKVHQGAGAETMVWDDQQEEEISKAGVSPVAVISVLAMLFSLVGVGLYMWQVNVERNQADALQAELLAQAMALPENLEAQVTGRDESELQAEEEEAAELSQIASTEMVARMEETLKNYLESDSVAERLKYVRDAERVAPLMRKFYGGGKIEPEGFREMAERRELAAGERIIATMVRVKDFTDYPVALELQDGQWKVDWESWVGYGDMRLADLREKKPQTDQLVRVTILLESYYNYDFSDDRQWVSFRLRFKDSFEDLWGYVKRGSPEEAAIIDQFKEQQEKAMRLRIKYPENPRNDDQVLITEVVGDGWVRLQEEN